MLKNEICIFCNRNIVINNFRVSKNRCPKCDNLMICENPYPKKLFTIRHKIKNKNKYGQID
jgi:hypothetical protein